MPKDTFFNLPEDKRTLICDIAIDEFAEYPFDQASINRIVAKSGIAKGSFYQYFENKNDLFLYLMGLIAEEKINYMSPMLSNPEEHDIFTLLREFFVSGIQFAFEHPRYAAIGDRILGNREERIYEELKGELLPTSYSLFEPLIEQAIARGEIRENIDIKVLNYYINSMNVIIVEYVSESHPGAVFESMIETADIFIDILKSGIGDNY